MLTPSAFRKLALSLEGATEKPHFELTSFRTKKIFATMDEKRKRVCLMLSPEDQSVFCAYDKNIIYPVPNKWGKSGATFVELSKADNRILKDALKVAYERSVGGKK
ncbi:MAG: MmcQ/YjbR family DNA-binding protein [Bacteroidota bacterium]